MASADPSLAGPEAGSSFAEHSTNGDRDPKAPVPNGNYTARGKEQDSPVIIRQGLIASFRYAFGGLAYCFRTQRNFRIHIAIGLLVTLAGLVLTLSWVEWAVVAVLVMVVLAAEMVNTMVEALVDLVTQEYHPLARVAKDVAAGVVLLSAIGSVVVGILIFLPKIVALFAK
jgi:diacylglycerol kinase (ATP)